MKFEIEDGTAGKGREIRFGYDPQEFPGFSWRGYAQMSSIQVSWYFAQGFGVKTGTWYVCLYSTAMCVQGHKETGKKKDRISLS